MLNLMVNFCAKLSFALLLSFYLIGSVFAYTDSIDLKQSIIALDKTRTNIIYELEAAQNPHLTKQEKHEYTIFIDYINNQIDYYCSKLISAKEKKLLKNLPCDVNLNAGINTSNKELKSTDEQIGTLDEILLSSLSDFDEMLLEEEKELNNKNISKKKHNQKSELEVYLETYENSAKNANLKSKDHNDSDMNRSASSQTNEHHSSGKDARNSANHKQSDKESRRIIKGDDDIVARQLREAAEQETDPDLKRKLWQEYDKYKQGNK